MRGRWFVFLSLVCCALSSTLTAEQEVTPEITSANEVKTLHGIILISSPECPYTPVSGIQAIDFDLPSNLKDSLQSYLEKPLCDELVKEIQNHILCFYQNAGCPFVYVCLPEQDVTDGFLIVSIQEARVGSVNWSGQNYCTVKDLEQHFVLQSSEMISQQLLLNDLTWLNRNPFHHTEAVLQPGAEEGTVDIELRTIDRFPVRLYGGADNTGNRYTDYTRLYAGINWGDALWRGDVFTYQFSAAPNINRFQAHFAQYVAFLPWRNILTLFGGYAQTHPWMEDEFSDFDTHGRSAQGSLRYTIPLYLICQPYKEEITCGFDWKYTNTNLFSIDFTEPLVISNANLLEFMASYANSCHTEYSDLTFNVAGHLSPTHWLPHQNTEAYTALREGAKVVYFYADALLGYDYTFDNCFSIATVLRGQVSTAALLPMQMFSLGGFNSVRGYLEHAYLADDALCANIELRAPPFCFHQCVEHKLTFLVFLDGGFGHEIDKISNLRRNDYLIGAGPGIRYSINNNLAARADYGVQLHRFQGDTHHPGTFHFGAQLSF